MGLFDKLTSLTGGGGLSGGAAAPSSAGGSTVRGGDVGGISAPVIIGPFKNDGTVGATTPSNILLYVGLVVAAVILWNRFRK